MLAESGVLPSDIQELTYDQLLFMATAFRRKEKRQNQLIRDVFKAASYEFNTSLIYLFGLYIGAGKKSDDAKPDALPPFNPLVLYAGHPEIMKSMYEKHDADLAGEGMADNEQFDELAETIMQDFDAGDLEPLFSGAHSDNQREKWMSPEYQAFVKSLGVEFVKKDG